MPDETAGTDYSPAEEDSAGGQIIKPESEEALTVKPNASARSVYLGGTYVPAGAGNVVFKGATKIREDGTEKYVGPVSISGDIVEQVCCRSLLSPHRRLTRPR